MSEAPVLEAESVTRRYGPTVALDGVSLAVAAGECVALVGESGAGKSTLLRCFNRLVDPDEGVVRVHGVDVRTLEPSALRRSLGYVPQEGGLLPHWRIGRNVALVPWLLHQSDPAGRAARALRAVGLDSKAFASRWPSELSGGERQRVALARALAAEPWVVLLDEPFGALDAITRSELQATFLELRRARGLTAVLVTHDLHEAALLADRIAVLRSGRIEQLASPNTLTRAPATAYVRELLARAQPGAM